jgi:putative transcriptional regulator
MTHVQGDGSEKDLDAAMPMEAARSGSADDPENPPLTPDRLRRLKRVPRMRTLRRALHLTQEEFAERYQIPIGTLRDWEQGRSEPDAPARAYLLVIASAPDVVRRALTSRD